VAVIGAGIAGLAAAQALVESGWDVRLFDKSRGPGGRLSTRRADPFAFDHGAQYFTVKDPHFARVVERWIAAGIVAPWHGRIGSLARRCWRPDSGHTERFVGVPSMSSLVRHLEHSLDIVRETRVTTIERVGDVWRLADERGADLGQHQWLVVGLPPPQAAVLIGASSPLGALASEVRMRPCWAVMLGLERRLPVDFDGAFVEDSALAWIARDSSKPGRTAAEAWVLHASAAWTEAHLDDPPERVVAVLCAELRGVSGRQLPVVRHAAAHLWRFASPDPALSLGAPADVERGLVLAGDAWNGARVEGAWLSGRAAAARIHASLPHPPLSAERG